MLTLSDDPNCGLTQWFLTIFSSSHWLDDVLMSPALSLCCISAPEVATPSPIQLSSQVTWSCQNSTFSFTSPHSTSFQVLLILCLNTFWIHYSLLLPVSWFKPASFLVWNKGTSFQSSLPTSTAALIDLAFLLQPESFSESSNDSSSESFNNFPLALRSNPYS